MATRTQEQILQRLRGRTVVEVGFRRDDPAVGDTDESIDFLVLDDGTTVWLRGGGQLSSDNVWLEWSPPG